MSVPGFLSYDYISHIIAAGVTIGVEVHTNVGRIDAGVETEGHIYIMEFKIGRSEETLGQIKMKKYYEPFLTSGKPITLVGTGSHKTAQNITAYQSESLVR